MASPFQNNTNQPASCAHQPSAAQEQPQPGIQTVRAEKRGGFECEFVEPPPDVLQSECPVCLLIIRDPYQISCCGYSFCQSCIQCIKADNKPCPTCNTKGFSDFADKRLKRSLYAFKVRCSHQKDGCEWTGELGQLDVHLNTDPLSEKQLDGCLFAKIDCLCCEEKMQRQYIQVHQNEHCTKRPFSCEHCHDYESNFDDVIHNHWPMCESFPVPCPNECGSSPQRQNVDSHVADVCPLTTISCDFLHVGCGVKLPHKDMPEHTRENLLTHLSLLAISHTRQQAQISSQQAQITSQQAQITSLVAENETLRGKNNNLKQTLEAESDSLQAAMIATSDSLQTEVAKLKTENQALKVESQSLREENVQFRQQLTALSRELRNNNVVPRTSIPLGPPVLTMTDFKQHKIDDGCWYSPPVYTHHRGYKICLRVYANGWDIGKGTHVGVCVNFMRGEFDDSLKWPFRGVISFRALDQVKGQDHKTHSITYNDTMEDKYCSRVTEREMSVYAWGSPEFIAHTELDKYLRNDTLFLQVYKVELK